MKIRIILLLFLLLLPAFFVSAAVPPATDEEQQQAVIRLTQRRFPAVADIIHYKIVPSNDGSRYFEADSTEFPRISITGSDGVAPAQGLATPTVTVLI